MLMEEQESDCGGADLELCKVAQVHESAFCEESQIRVTKPDEKAAGALLIDARILVKGLRATEAGLRVEQVFACTLLGKVGHYLHHGAAHFN